MSENTDTTYEQEKKTCSCHDPKDSENCECEKEAPSKKRWKRKDFKQEIEQAKQETKEYKDKYVRLLAEKENLVKRLQKEKQDSLRFAVENSLCEWLPILDNFEKALHFSKEASEEVNNWALGFQMLLSQMKDILLNAGIVSFHSKGNMFDPFFHEAVEIMETDDYPDGTILEEFSKGYKSSNRTLKHAKVKVAKPKKLEEENINKQKEEDKNHE